MGIMVIDASWLYLTGRVSFPKFYMPPHHLNLFPLKAHLYTESGIAKKDSRKCDPGKSPEVVEQP
jgi:hypothetical protein